MDQRIVALLIRGGFGTGSYWPWFQDARLVSGKIVTPHADLAGSIRRCFLPKFRDVLPDCDVMLGGMPEPSKPRVNSVFKRGYQPVKQGNML